MKIVLISIGTRGDMEPFLAIGELLKKKGHEILCVFPEQFRELTQESKLEFKGLTSKFIKLLESDDAKVTMDGKGISYKKLKAYISLYKKSNTVNKLLVKQQHDILEKEKPDKVIYSIKATYPVIWGIKNPNKSYLISPIPCLIHAVKNHAAIGFKGNYGTLINNFTYFITNIAIVSNIVSSTKKYMNIYNISKKKIKKELIEKRIIYTVSPSIFKKPQYWKTDSHVLGYHSRKINNDWKADNDLIQFMNMHNKILFITFGSMTNPNPRETMNIILEILEEQNIKAIINTASGGLIKPLKYNTNSIYFTENIPYAWIFPKVYAVMHHGGSGTTHMGLKYSCATLIIPHILDQFLWNDLISSLNVGPKGIPINKLKKEILSSKIVAMMHNKSYKGNAIQLGKQMRKENYKKVLYQTLVEKKLT
ncbi:MAG: glycosyltransferase [Polaribacter sp.]|uniref:glycosyltransferase n=1 Tax=Polaribacter sp. TaxID=1920175 RepID=UPI003BB042CE